MVLGLDIGGANLKAVHRDGTAHLQPFALWKQPEQLANVLRDMTRRLPAFDVLAVTMTGELCDCFATKRAGVLAILDAVEQAAAGKPLLVWNTTGQFTNLAAARREPLAVAAANWLALATFAGRFVPAGPALLIDIGSTTTDIIPLLDGKPMPTGRTDSERLRTSELVYTGVQRTPICALSVGKVMAELFATTLDAYLLLGELPENEATDTADGRPATKPFAHARLARMLGGDAESCTSEDTQTLARKAVAFQHALLRHAVAQVCHAMPASPVTFVLAGAGEFLARRVLHLERVPADRLLSLTQRLGPCLSTAACAQAVAVLAGEQPGV